MGTPYVHRKSDTRLWTVGYYEPSGKWYAMTDHDNEAKASEHVHYLNGGTVDKGPVMLDWQRAQIAAMCLQGLLSSPHLQPNDLEVDDPVESAIVLADRLIANLKETHHEV